MSNKKTLSSDNNIMTREEEKGYWKALLKYYGKYKFLTFSLLIACLLYTVFAIFIPIIEGKMLASFEDFNSNIILKLAAILVIIKVMSEVIDYLWCFIVIKLDYNINFDLKMDILDAMMNLETSSYDKTSSGVFLSRINEDTKEIAQIVDAIFADASGIISNVGFIFYIFYLNYILGFFMLIYIVVLHFMNSRKANLLKRAVHDEKTSSESIVGTYNDIIRGIREIKNLNLKEYVRCDASKKEKKFMTSKCKTFMVKTFWNRSSSSVKYILDFLFVALSVYLILHKTLLISSFLIIFLYKNNLLNLIEYISTIRENLASSSIAAKRTFDIINYSEYSKENFGTLKVNDIKGNIEFRNVSFKYNKEGKNIFEDLSFKVPQNKMTAIVGKSGEGKSTILRMITKGYEVSSGDILIDNINLKDISEESLKKSISIVSQVPYIFNLSILDNIKLANPYASFDKVVEVCKKAQIHDIIDAMPDKYDTIVGENGVILSGGQKQRLAIARALIKDSKIILLDEATSALDNQNQEKIKSVISELSRDHTIVIIAHRLSTIVDADNILVIDNHKVIASGRHNELIKKCDAYKNLYNIESTNDDNDFKANYDDKKNIGKEL